MISASSSIRQAVLRSAVQRASRSLTQLPNECAILLHQHHHPLLQSPTAPIASAYYSSTPSVQHATTSRMASSMPLSDYPYDTDDDDDEEHDEDSSYVTAPLVEPNIQAIEQTYQNLANLLGVDKSRVHPHFCNHVIKKLCKRKDEASFRRADQIVTEMERLGQDINGTTMMAARVYPASGRPVAVPDVYTYIFLMKGYLYTGEHRYTERARATLDRMDYACQVGYCSDTLQMSANDVFRQTFIFARPNGVNERRDNADLCLQMLLEMERPKTKALNMVLHKLAMPMNHHDHSSNVKAEKLLRNACEWYLTRENHSDCRPDLISFNTTMKAHAERGEGVKAESIFRFMEELQSMGNTDFGPDIFTYSAVIAAWCGDRRSSPKFKAEKATLLLEKMQDSITNGQLSTDLLQLNMYTNVLRQWDNCGSNHGAERAEAIVRGMEDMADKGFIKMKPNTIIYNALLSIVGARRMPEKCEEILQKMNRLHRDGDASVKPDVISYTSYCKACALDSSFVAHKRTFNIIQGMEQDFESGVSDIEPDVLTYQTLFSSKGYALREGGNVAEKILRHMEERYEIKGYVKSKPSMYTYLSVMQAWLRSANHRKVDKMYDILCRCEDMDDEHVRPQLIMYNMVLEACANVSQGNVEQNTNVILTGMKTFQKIRDSSTPARLKPSSQTYLSLLETCAKKIEEGPKRNKAIGTMFQHCTADGVVDSRILHSIKQHSPVGLQATLLGGGGENYNERFVTIQDLPKEWTVNSSGDGQVKMRSRTRRMIHTAKTKNARHRLQNL